jgi:acetyl-CoA acetyltransferase family protein
VTNHSPSNSREVVIVDGVRTPFIRSAGAYAGWLPHELAARPLRVLAERLIARDVDAAAVDAVAMGSTVHETNTPNVAREAMLAAGYAPTTPAWTTSMAGLSPNLAITTVADAIYAGRAEFGVAGGVETFSEAPIRLSRGIRRAAMVVRMARTRGDTLRGLVALRPRDLALDLPRSGDITTDMTMGEATERMAGPFGVTRADADAWAMGSHTRAVEAWTAGRYDDQVALVADSPGGPVRRDNGPRSDTSPAKLAALAPAFRADGLITAGNASGFTDGAAAIALASRTAAETRGLPVRAVLRGVRFVGVPDLHDEHLIGPALAIPGLLDAHGLTLADVDVVELHEAFASQVLAVLSALASNTFARTHLNRTSAVGEVDPARVNAWGGSIALGNPFSATGARLLLTAVDRLQAEDGRWAIVSSCAGGGLGVAMLLERQS